MILTDRQSRRFHNAFTTGGTNTMAFRLLPSHSLTLVIMFPTYVLPVLWFRVCNTRHVIVGVITSAVHQCKRDLILGLHFFNCEHSLIENQIRFGAQLRPQNTRSFNAFNIELMECMKTNDTLTGESRAGLTEYLIGICNTETMRLNFANT